MAASPTQQDRKRVFLVDDHPLVRQGVALSINHEPDLIVCGEADNVAQALTLIESLKPHLVIVDISLKGRDGIDLTKEILARDPKMPVLVLSMHDESLYAERAIRAGARGYVMKEEPPQVLIDAIRKALDGKVHVSEAMTARMFASMVGQNKPPPATSAQNLTDRELEILHLLGRGYSTSEVGGALHLSEKTISAHRENIKRKMNFKSSFHLLRHAILLIESPFPPDPPTERPPKRIEFQRGVTMPRRTRPGRKRFQPV